MGPINNENQYYPEIFKQVKGVPKLRKIDGVRRHSSRHGGFALFEKPEANIIQRSVHRTKSIAVDCLKMFLILFIIRRGDKTGESVKLTMLAPSLKSIKLCAKSFKLFLHTAKTALPACCRGVGG